MNKYRIDDHTLDLIEASPIPFAVYQFVSRRVVTLALSAGFCRLFGYEDRARAYHDMDEQMYVDTHPDDVSRISEAAVLFATRGGRYDVIYRSRDRKTSGYRLIHAVGEHASADDGTRLAYVWYTDEGEYKEDASKADENKKEVEEYASKLESKVKEFESAYFDLQMENIQLKDELSKLKR